MFVVQILPHTIIITRVPPSRDKKIAIKEESNSTQRATTKLNFHYQYVYEIKDKIIFGKTDNMRLLAQATIRQNLVTRF